MIRKYRREIYFYIYQLNYEKNIFKENKKSMSKRRAFFRLTAKKIKKRTQLLLSS